MKRGTFLSGLLMAVACLLLGVGPAHAGSKVKIQKGSDLSALKPGVKVKIEFDYTGTRVGRDTQEDYIARKMGEREADEAGNGERWKENWLADRDRRYHPRFIKLINKYWGEYGISVGRGETGPDLLLRVRVLRLEPGFYSYMYNKPAEVDLEITLSLAAAPDNVLATVHVYDATGTSMIAMQDSGERLGEAFAKAGKDWARYIAKKAKLK